MEKTVTETLLSAMISLNSYNMLCAQAQRWSNVHKIAQLDTVWAGVRPGLSVPQPVSLITYTVPGACVGHQESTEFTLIHIWSLHNNAVYVCMHMHLCLYMSVLCM